MHFMLELYDGLFKHTEAVYFVENVLKIVHKVLQIWIYVDFYEDCV